MVYGNNFLRREGFSFMFLIYERLVVVVVGIVGNAAFALSKRLWSLWLTLFLGYP